MRRAADSGATPMSRCEVPSETVIRGDDARAERQWSETSTSVRSDQPDRPILGERVIEAQQDGDAVVVVPAGEFDLPAAGPVREALMRAFSESRQRLIIDLSQVTFMDSSGLHVILDAYKLCRDTGRAMTIRPGPSNVQRVFEVTSLLECLPFERGA